MPQDQLNVAFIFDWSKRSIRSKGITGFADFMFSFCTDYLFDLRYGTNTGGRIPPSQFKTCSSNVRHSVRYQASKARPLKLLLQRLSLPRDCVFVDVGSGKGKALLIASGFGFKRLIGVEFSRDLCEISRSNIKIFKEKTGCQADISAVESDIDEYDIKNDENIFYLYNPFDEIVMQKFLEKIKRSIDNYERKIWLIYHIAEHDDIAAESKLFWRATQYTLGGTEFIVYESG